MIIFVYGDDSFRVQEKVRVMRDAFAAKFDPTGLNTAEFPAENATKIEPGEALQAICSAPFMSEKRLVVLRDLMTNLKKDQEAVWLEGLSKTPDSSVVILSESDSPKQIEKKALFKKLREAAEVHCYPFPRLEGPALSKWVASRIQERGGQMEPAAIRELVERVGADLWQLDAEVQKLVAHANGRPITVADIEALVRASFEGEIFALIDVISKKQTANALKRLEEERLSGANDHYLLTMLARQVRLLLAARALLDENPRTSKEELADAMGIHSFPASKALQQARAFAFEDLKRVHGHLFAYDRLMKSGGITTPLAVDLIATELME